MLTVICDWRKRAICLMIGLLSTCSVVAGEQLFEKCSEGKSEYILSSQELIVIESEECCWMPDSHLLLTTNGESIEVLDIEQLELTDLYASPVGKEINGLSVSSDGRHVAFLLETTGRSGASSLYVLNMQTKEVGKISREYRNLCGVSWSPDSNIVIFSALVDHRPFGKRWKIFLMSPDDGAETVLVSGAENQETPLWASDGFIYYLRNRGDGVARCTMLGAVDSSFVCLSTHTYPTSFISDGNILVLGCSGCDENTRIGTKIMRVDDGVKMAKLTIQGEKYTGGVSFSEDLMYVSFDVIPHYGILKKKVAKVMEVYCGN